VGRLSVLRNQFLHCGKDFCTVGRVSVLGEDFCTVGIVPVLQNRFRKNLYRGFIPVS
jgi:hypothetical protein